MKQEMVEWILQGICATKGYYFRLENFWKIKFFKQSGKPWFTYTFPDMTEENADKLVEEKDGREKKELCIDITGSFLGEKTNNNNVNNIIISTLFNTYFVDGLANINNKQKRSD